MTSFVTKKYGGTGLPVSGMLVTLLLCRFFSIDIVSSLPMIITVNPHSKECLFDYVDEGESITVSIFILSGAELKGGLSLEGPLSRNSGDDLSSGVELQQITDSYDHHGSGNRLFRNIIEDVNFERMLSNEAAGSYDDDDDGYGRADDDDLNLWLQEDDEHMDDDEILAEKRRSQMLQRRKRAMEARKRALEARHRREERMKANNIVKDGEPIQRTIKADLSGWYRACLRGSWYRITAEFEMRKDSDLGGIDPETGHVFTYAKRDEIKEREFLEADSPNEEEEMLKDEDFNTVKYQLERLRHALSDIQQKQVTERHRLLVHAATNEHSHSRMVLSSLFQTILFMAVTGFQIYTIRKWFCGDADNTLLRK